MRITNRFPHGFHRSFCFALCILMLLSGTVFAAEHECPSTAFLDLPEEDHWAHEAIDWGVENDYIKGMSENTLAPEEGCTRAMVITLLWRIKGSPEPKDTAKLPFTDVPEDAYYYDALLWATDLKIAKGITENTFGPDILCTRAQAVAFIRRTVLINVIWWGGKGPNHPFEDFPFTDVTLSDYYFYDVEWANSTKIAQGTAADRFSPDLPCTRAQLITFLYRTDAGDWFRGYFDE